MALADEKLLFSVAVFPEFLDCPQNTSGERAPSRCTALKGKKGGGTEEALQYLSPVLYPCPSVRSVQDLFESKIQQILKQQDQGCEHMYVCMRVCVFVCVCV